MTNPIFEKLFMQAKTVAMIFFEKKFAFYKKLFYLAFIKNIKNEYYL